MSNPFTVHGIRNARSINKWTKEWSTYGDLHIQIKQKCYKNGREIKKTKHT